MQIKGPVNADQCQWLADRYDGGEQSIVETIELPEELGSVLCQLYGPSMGDDPVPEFSTFAGRDWKTASSIPAGDLANTAAHGNGGAIALARGRRPWPSRCVLLPERETRTISVCFMPATTAHRAHVLVIAGPAQPPEPDAPSVPDREWSTRFWREHAITVVGDDELTQAWISAARHIMRREAAFGE